MKKKPAKKPIKQPTKKPAKAAKKPIKKVPPKPVRKAAKKAPRKPQAKPVALSRFEIASRRLADVADSSGMLARDVIRFPDLVAQVRLKSGEVTAEVATHADHILRQRIRATLERAKNLTKEPIP